MPIASCALKPNLLTIGNVAGVLLTGARPAETS
jgi:hypothetical protein